MGNRSQAATKPPEIVNPIHATESAESHSKSEPEQPESPAQQDFLPFMPFVGNKAGTQLLHRQFKSMIKRNPETNDGFRVNLVEENIYKWQVHFLGFPLDSPIG